MDKNKLNEIYGKNSDCDRMTRNVAKCYAVCYLYVLTSFGFCYCDTDSLYRNDRKGKHE